MRVPECKFYDSKMHPLLLAYDNPDQSAVLQDVRIMFKHGDGQCHYVTYVGVAYPSVSITTDLRQHMLTLQIINIMDSIWQQEGLDLRCIHCTPLTLSNCRKFYEQVWNLFLQVWEM